MKINSCSGGIVLFADVKEEDGQKSIVGWHLQDANDQELKAEKGPDSDGRATIIQAETGNACFIIEQKTKVKKAMQTFGGALKQWEEFNDPTDFTTPSEFEYVPEGETARVTFRDLSYRLTQACSRDLKS
jgi:hypothetical protein